MSASPEDKLGKFEHTTALACILIVAILFYVGIGSSWLERDTVPSFHRSTHPILTER